MWGPKQREGRHDTWTVDKTILHGSVNKAILEAADRTIPDKNKVCRFIPHAQHCRAQSVLYTDSYANVLWHMYSIG